MSFSEFYQRSINEPEQFWAEQAGVLTGRRPLRKRSTTATRRLPVGFVKAEPTCVTTLSIAGWRNSQRRWH
ncbi:propionate--coA ligase [Escherichia coli]|uniref:Propionate--coA ligase n=1 Tax=Escherichia coli TaxID=562 RepID=A0A484VWX2_ECOLX|nr:propionate--coA ligase [Escherichia coli]